MHLFFSDQGAPRDFVKRIKPGIDIQHDGVYVVAAPSSIYPHLVDDGVGGTYAWERPPLGLHLPRLSDWFWKSVERKPQPVGPARWVSNGQPSAKQLDALVRCVSGAVVGERDSILYWAAKTAAAEVAQGAYPGDEAYARLYEAGVCLGQSPQEVARALRDLAKGVDTWPAQTRRC